ncbi:hypothetical protein C8R45DRAFT_1101479 [Mycena sanguinolenta]|nr:hypothetical protein C8R45DRAFT_1101479 [Mycena sanguinolenta]
MSVNSASASGAELISEPISATDVYPAPFRPPTSRALSTNPPPRKRQRLSKPSAGPNTIPQSIRRLLDIEADEDRAEEDEEEDDEGGEFIDDEPDHDVLVYPFIKLEEPTNEDPEALRRIAARFEDATRKEREECERRMDAEDSHDGDAILTGLVAPPLRGFIVAPHWELRLVDFMKTLEHMGMVGTQGPWSRLVFYETVPDETLAKSTVEIKVTDATQAWLTAHGVWFRGPEEIAPFESLALLGLRDASNPHPSPIDQRYNCFARLKSRIWDGVYENDLVFIDTARNAQIYVVPRLHFGPAPLAKGQRPPRRLLHTEALKLHLADENLQFLRGGIQCMWGERVFAPFSGLEVLSSDLDYSLDRVHPTEDELELFWASKCHEISVPFMGVTSALQEGDRVVVVNPTTGASEDYGEITAFFERHEEDQCLRMAVVVLPRQDGRTADLDPTTGRLAVKRIGGIDVNGVVSAVHVSELRLHILSPRRVVSVGDRVVVVAGPAYRGQSRRIITFSTTLTILLDSPDLGELEAVLRHVRLDFRLGDMVRVVRGPHKDEIGLIVGLYLGGGIEIYLCDITRMNARIDSQTGGMKLSVESAKFNTTEMTAEEALVIRLQTCNVVFVHLEGNDLLQSIERRREADKEVDRARHEWERDVMNTGRFLTDMFVRIVGKHPTKGHFGVIVDYHCTKPAPEGCDRMRRIAEWGDLRHDVCIHVMVEHSRVADEVELDNVVERFSGLPVLMAVLLKGYHKLMVFERPSRPCTPPAIERSAIHRADLTTAELQSSNVLKPAPVDVGTGAGKTNRKWLAHPQMTWKRIDAQLCDADTLLKLLKTPNVGNRIGVKAMKMADAEGYVRPFGFAIAEEMAYMQVQELIALGKNVKVPIVALRPLRRTPVDGVRSEMCCISARQCRVIVIGPDVKGSRGRIGQYAETIPPHSLSSSGGIVIRVCFVWEKTKDGADFQPQAEYDLQCLCSALNRDTPSQPPVPPTDFNKKCA